MKIGDRVGAIVSADDKTVTLFGYGTYQGEEIPPPDIIGPFGAVTVPNPKIVLDNGDVIWGCECWWRSEEKIHTMIGEREIIMVTSAQYRGK